MRHTDNESLHTVLGLQARRGPVAFVLKFVLYTALVLSIQPSGRVVDFPAVLLPTSLRLGTYRQAFVEGHRADDGKGETER